MSLAVLTWVFKYSEAKLANRLVLLALADYAHDDGSKAFPSIPTLAAKARVSERTAIRCLQALVKDGEIEQTGKTRGGTKIYKVLMGHDNLSHANLSPDNGGVAGVTSTAAGGDIHGSALHREPLEPSPKPSPVTAGGGDPTRETHPLCFLLADLLAANGVPESKRKVTKRWADAERLMKDRDDRDPAQMEVLLRWGTSHAFWRSNLLSMVGFREKYDQIRLQAERESRPQGNAGGARSSADADVERLEQIRRKTEEQERGEP